MQNDDMSVKASALTVFICFLFGANPVAIKFCLTGLGAFTAAGIRFAIAALVIFAWARYKKIPLKISQKQLGQMLILAAIFVVQLSCFYQGMGKTTASHGALIANVLPFMVLIMAHFFIPGDTISLKKGVGITLGFLGVLFLFFDEQDLTGELKTGDLIVLAAVFFWSSSAVFVKRIISHYNVVQITIYPMIFSIPFFFLGGFLWDDQMIKMIDPAVINAMLYQSFVTASFGFIAWNTLLQKFGATALHSFIFIMPLAGVLFGVLLLGEVFTLHLAISIGFIVAGVIIVNLRRRKRPVSVH
ncbi:MAG: DMT family transporter [Desulfobacula sp.]|uniref:DMT family transporter n=1 Tax=Desulfobacula sp. TaxID=2593537 RepID=UPI001D77915C|nr:DMT family transporter [Desulfobacula sp.]MBT3483999.1 DMT family transporter [Desulfobacula sp.]MBT3803814.1 DMT family transporter [Desulfobacula sp.]MBT4023759.1 DMT family transporter [Desulfobacula sp.]MBT4197681.1 DMT family transporter [Desulfobacula sp.]